MGGLVKPGSEALPFGGTERFRVLRRIGEGGMGVVYEALDHERNTHVALKTLRTREPRAILRLKHEFRALRDLQHPNLVSFGELFESRGDWFFTMELVRGIDVLELGPRRRWLDRRHARGGVDGDGGGHGAKGVEAVADAAAGGGAGALRRVAPARRACASWRAG